MTRKWAHTNRSKLVVFAIALAGVASLALWPSSDAQALPPAITLDSAVAHPTGLISVKGVRGFQNGEPVDLYVDSANVETTRGASMGGFSFIAVNVPTPAAPGTHWITAVGRTSGASAQASFRVTSDWPAAGFGATREGTNMTENVLKPTNVSTVSQRWTTAPGGAITAPVVAADTTTGRRYAFVGSADGNLIAYDADGCGQATCPALWSGAAGGSITSPPTAYGATVYVSSSNGTLAAFPLAGCGSATCTPAWTASFDKPAAGSPAVAPDQSPTGPTRVFVATTAGYIWAFDAAGCGAATCPEMWSSKVGGTLMGAAVGKDPQMNKQLVFTVSSAGRATSVLATTGLKQWSKQTATSASSGPVFAPNIRARTGLVYFTGDGTLWGVKTFNGATVWQSSDTAADPVNGTPLVAVSRVYVTSDTQLYSYDAGARRCKLCVSIWRSPMSIPTGAAPIAGNGVVYATTDNGHVRAVSASGCVRLDGDCSTPLLDSPPVAPAGVGSPALSDGTLYVTGSDGTLSAVGLASPPSPPARPDPSALVADPTPIRHVVVIFQENHSFDNTFGYMCVNELAGACDGAVTGKRLDNSVIPLTQATDVVPQVSHNDNAQINAVNGGQMNGWERIGGCQPAKDLRCFSQFHPDQIPTLSALAKSYVISDRTFQTTITATFGAHMQLGSVTLDGFTGDFPKTAVDFPAGPGWGCDSLLSGNWRSSPQSPEILVPSCVPTGIGSGPYKPSPVQHVPDTTFDRMDAAGLSWRTYDGDQLWSNGSVWSVCPTFADCLFSTQSANVTQSRNVVTDAENGTLPNLSLVMPKPGGNSQHNGTSMIQGDNWIGEVVNAVMSGPDWNDTAIFITYDDCGCFYDHVTPPTGRGPRLPMVIVSPYAKAGFVDHGSTGLVGMTAYTERVFGLPPLTSDDATAYGYEDAFDYSQNPLARISLPSHAVSAKVKAYLKANPPTDIDPE